MIACHRVCLLLGSNIKPEANIPAAVALLRQELRVIKVSSLWETEAVGSDGPNFLNLALLAETPLDAASIKQRIINQVETRLGRQRTADKNAPRTIDLDIILFDDQLFEPQLWQFAHVAVPVAELLPDYPEPASGERLVQTATRLAGSTSIRRRQGVLD